MIIKISDNIISPLGLSSQANIEAVKAGKTQLSLYEGMFGLPEPFCGSLLDREAIERIADEKIGEERCREYTFFEKICILSAEIAIKESGLDADSEDVVFYLSTTKGNVSLLEENLTDERCYLGYSASRISQYFGNRNEAVVVSNACISGVCAQIAAVRALLTGKYRTAVIIGADVLSKFIVSGFQSFKALSPEPCRPYDADRKGLNLGEAAGTIILRRVAEDYMARKDGVWRYAASSIHNDANHISGPSRTGEGAYRVLSDIIDKVDISQIGFVNAHGTATAYNDEMESIAIHRARLEDIPVNGFKGYYGHTLGAAGIIETILSMKAVEEGIIPATKGFEKKGTTYPVKVSSDIRNGNRAGFIKILSGFGGSNAGISYVRD